MTYFLSTIKTYPIKTHRCPFHALLEKADLIFNGRPVHEACDPRSGILYSPHLEYVVTTFLMDMYCGLKIHPRASSEDVRGVMDVLDWAFWYGYHDSIKLRSNLRRVLSDMREDIVFAMIGDTPIEGCEALEACFCLEKMQRTGKIKYWRFDAQDQTPLGLKKRFSFKFTIVPNDETEEGVQR